MRWAKRRSQNQDAIAVNVFLRYEGRQKRSAPALAETGDNNLQGELPLGGKQKSALDFSVQDASAALPQNCQTTK